MIEEDFRSKFTYPLHQVPGHYKKDRDQMRKNWRSWAATCL